VQQAAAESVVALVAAKAEKDMVAVKVVHDVSGVIVESVVVVAVMTVAIAAVVFTTVNLLVKYPFILLE
ncbi:MAG: hypothetical protein K2X08_06790, partial [Chlamydiales bacterium]|nr:hypothetical protein [Chlamydiales bacterium]